MKITEIRQKTKEDLDHMLQERRRRMEELRIDIMQKKAKDTSELGKIRKEIAQILTVGKEKS